MKKVYFVVVQDIHGKDYMITDGEYLDCCPIYEAREHETIEEAEEVLRRQLHRYRDEFKYGTVLSLYKLK